MTGPPRGELFVQTWQSGKMYRILVSDVIKAEAGSQPNAVCMELHRAHQAISNAQLFSFIIVFLLLGKYKWDGKVGINLTHEYTMTEQYLQSTLFLWYEAL